MAIQYHFIDWNIYTTHAKKLASILLEHDSSIQEIIAISRGGLTFGHLLSDLLQVPIWTIAIQSYTDIQQQGEVQILGTLQTSIEQKHVLLIDDVSDSGRTFQRAIEYLTTLRPRKVTTMTMFLKPQSSYRPDYFAEITNAWVVFPYEHTEMILLITKRMQQEGKKESDIQSYLQQIGFDEQTIAFAWKHHL